MSLHFHQLLRKKLQKVSHFVRKHEKSSIWPNLCNFSNKLPCLYISMNFSEKVAKSASFREKVRKTIDLAKTCNFSSKLPCLGIFMNFSARRCKKCLISWKSTKNHRFRQHYATFRTNYHVFAFRWTFKEKVGKRCSFGEKARKIMDLVKTCNFWNKLPCFYVSENFSANSCKNWLISWESTKTHRCSQNYATFSNKLPCFGFSINFWAKGCKRWLNSWKSTKNHLFGKNFATSRTNYHVFAFRSTFQEKVAKSAPFREKARRIIDLAKTLQLFEQTTMSLHFDELFRKKLQKVRRLVKKHEKSSILSTCNFPRKLPCFDVSMNIAAKSCQTLLVPWKSTKNHQFGQIFTTFRTNFDVFAFRWIFKEKVAKSASFREKERKIIDLAKTLQLFEKTTMFWHFDEVFSKKLQKVPHFVKKHEESSIWRKFATFPTNYHVFAFRWIFKEKVAKSASFREKARTPIDLAKTCNFSKKLPCFGISIIIAGKSCKKVEKVAHFVKNDEKSSIWPKLATFRGNYHVSAFFVNFSAKS